MAVYTKLNEINIKEVLSNYSIGSLNNFKGIQEGIENTNYFLLVNKKKYILTLYEKRVKEEDLPFFSELMGNLNKSGFKCPIPILNNNNYPISEYKNKKLMIISFIEGKVKKGLMIQDVMTHPEHRGQGLLNYLSSLAMVNLVSLNYGL